MKIEKEDMIYPPLALLLVTSLLLVAVAPFALSWLIIPVFGVSFVVALFGIAIGSTLP